MSNPDRERPFRHVPKVQPDRFGDFPAFRETFLAVVRDVEANEALRAFGKLQHELVLEALAYRPQLKDVIDSLAHDLQAALADLRHLQGFLAFCSEDYEDSGGVEQRHEALCQFAARLSAQVGAIADELDQEVGNWEFE